MGNLWCCHDSSYEVLEAKEQTTYTKARELTRQHKKKIKDVCNDAVAMDGVVNRIRTYIADTSVNTVKGEVDQETVMVCPKDLDRDTWRAALQSQKIRIKTIHPSIHEVTSDAVYYSTINLDDVISRIRQAVFEEAERGKNYVYLTRPGDLSNSTWNVVLRYHIPTLKNEFTGFQITHNVGCSSISLSW